MAPGVRVVPDQLLLLGIDRQHRDAGGQGLLGAGIDMPELRIAIRTVCALLGLARALQTVVLLVE
jgi:hypothetical protein